MNVYTFITVVVTLAAIAAITGWRNGGNGMSQSSSVHP